MKADISRSTFRSTRHYSGVLLQQGRVQLDADFNEQVAIGQHRDRVMTRDVVGPSGAPAVGGGFALGAAVLLEGVGLTGSRGVAVGERGTLLVSVPSDGPPVWQARDSGTTAELHAVSVVDDENAWAVGSGTTIVRGAPSSDVGWNAQSTPAGVDSDLRGVHFRDGSAGVAVGTGAVVLATTDGGDTWTRQTVPGGVTEDLNAVHFPSGDVGFAVGAGGRILTFANGAWTEQSAPVGFTATLRAVRFENAQEGWAAGDGGALLSTTDGGGTWVWRDPPLGVTAALRGVALADGAVWAVGDDATVIRSTDAGATWTQLGAPGTITADLRAATALSPSAVLVAGDVSTVADVDAEGGWSLQPVPSDARDLWISAGRLYVDGLLCANERAVRYGAQDDLPEPPDGAFGPNLVYLDVWERHVTALEDAGLREVALGGPDTATRSKTVWQVKLAGIDESPSNGACDPFPPDWVPPAARSTGRLRARAEEAQVQTSECMVPLGGGYRRLENQLYRVEIHDPGTGAAATYKWSRDNGSVVGRLEAIDPKSPSDFSAGELTISEPGRDMVIGFGGAAVVELSNEGRILRGEPGILLEVDTITGNAIKWKGYTGPAFSLTSLAALPTVRRWEGTASVDVGQWTELEGGIWIEFDGGDFKTGDHWTIPARTRTGAVEWPTEDGTPVFQSRRGIEHRYAPLGFANRLEDGTWSVQGDCRPMFDPLTELATLLYLGGDGQEAKLGTTLPQPLAVGVFRGRRPIRGAHIRFIAEEGGLVGPVDDVTEDSGRTLEVDTDDDGVAACSWRLATDPARPSQEVTASLLDDLGNELAPFVRFSGRLSLAGEVTYLPDEACPDLAEAADVQAAIDILCKRPTHYAAADIDYTPECALLKRAKALNVQAAITELCRNLGAAPEPDALVVRVQQRVLTNVEDQAGRWQHEGGQVFDTAGKLVGAYSSTKRITTQAVDPLNAGTVTMTIFFFGSSPPENVTVQGSHDFGSGKQVGSVSAASSTRAAYIGQPFIRDGVTVTLGTSGGSPG